MNCDDQFGCRNANERVDRVKYSKEYVFQSEDDGDDIGRERTIARPSADDLDENIADEAQADALGNRERQRHC